MRTEFPPAIRFLKSASGGEKQNQANVSGFLVIQFITIYYHKNPYIPVSSGHILGTVLMTFIIIRIYDRVSWVPTHSVQFHATVYDPDKAVSYSQ
jgi:hypothetical protein